MSEYLLLFHHQGKKAPVTNPAQGGGGPMPSFMVDPIFAPLPEDNTVLIAPTIRFYKPTFRDRVRRFVMNIKLSLLNFYPQYGRRTLIIPLSR